MSETQNLKHFLQLAQRGKHPGTSGGERRAYRIAKAILDDVHGLDGQAVEGLMEFVQLANLYPSEAEMLVEFGRRTLEKKGGKT
jgi:hypothetical protein